MKTAETVSLAYMAQHASNAGQRVPCPEDRYGEDWRYSPDLLVLDGTEAEHVEWARDMLDSTPWCGPYYSRVARGVLDYFGASEDAD